MELQAIEAAPRPAPRPVQLVLVRANGPLFYSVAAASILETTAPGAAERLLHFFGADEVLARWMRGEWLPRKAERAKQLRVYVQTTWPEYDWHAGIEQFRAAEQADGGGTLRRPTAAHEALARCVATAQSGIFYRSLARWADDARLRELARAIALEEAASFSHVCALYDRRVRSQGFGCVSAWTPALACVRDSRDSLVPRAFTAISAHCAPHVPFPVLEYGEFVTRMSAVIERHANLGTPERILFRTWKGRPRVRLATPTPSQSLAFRPVLQRI